MALRVLPPSRSQSSPSSALISTKPAGYSFATAAAVVSGSPKKSSTVMGDFVGMLVGAEVVGGAVVGSIVGDGVGGSVVVEVLVLEVVVEVVVEVLLVEVVLSDGTQ